MPSETCCHQRTGTLKRLDLSCTHLFTPQPGAELMFRKCGQRDRWVDGRWMGRKFSGWLDGTVEESEKRIDGREGDGWRN